MTTKFSFYRRELPTPPCISLQSEDGQQALQRAMIKGTAKAFFPLIGQLTTQDEPAYCGLASLVMVLNALSIDPGSHWKGPWRWYHESMLDCCQPLEVIQKQGITFDEGLCLARCNHAALRYSSRPTAESEEELALFRKRVIASCQSNNSFIIASYSRKALKQTGDGHFSPLGAYDQETDHVLILDTARFKYPCHWVPLPLLYKAMAEYQDKATGLQRGYFCMEKLAEDRFLLTINQHHPLATAAVAPNDIDLTSSSDVASLKNLVELNATLECCSKQLCLPKRIGQQLRQLVQRAQQHPLWDKLSLVGDQVVRSTNSSPNADKQECRCYSENEVDESAMGKLCTMMAALLLDLDTPTGKMHDTLERELAELRVQRLTLRDLTLSV